MSKTKTKPLKGRPVVPPKVKDHLKKITAETIQNLLREGIELRRQGLTIKTKLVAK